MPRHEEHPGGSYTKLVQVMLNEEGLAHLDRLRGTMPRSAYFRMLLKAEVRHQREAEKQQLPKIGVKNF